MIAEVTNRARIVLNLIFSGETGESEVNFDGWWLEGADPRIEVQATVRDVCFLGLRARARGGLRLKKELLEIFAAFGQGRGPI